MSRRRWKEYQLASYDTFHELSSRWQSSSKAFGADGRMFFDGGSQHVTTNIADRDVRRLLAYSGCRIPEPMMLRDDDDVLWEVLEEHGEHATLKALKEKSR